MAKQKQPGGFSEVEMKYIAGRLSEIGVTKLCSICGKEGLFVDGRIHKFVTYSGVDDLINYRECGWTKPVIMVMCNNCGHVNLYSLQHFSDLLPKEYQ